MKKSKNLQFIHEVYGICGLEPLISLKELQDCFSILQNKKKNRDLQNDCLARFIHNFKDLSESKHFLCFKVVSNQLGLFGALGLKKSGDHNAELFFYLNADSDNRDLQKLFLDDFIDHAFSCGFCLEITVKLSNASQLSEEILNQCGLTKNEDAYQTSPMLRKLFLLSNIIKSEAKNMISNREAMAQEIGGRVSNLWYSYFCKGGVNLSGGGIEKSILSLKDLIHSPSLIGFNTYQHEEAPVISEERIKKFLVEEKVFKSCYSDSFGATFSLGAHEAFMRLSRCVFHSDENTAMFLSMSCYGLFPAALSAMRPIPYDTVLVDIDRNRGEKISISHFRKLIRENPKAKSLCLELKTMCGSVYSESEVSKIISLCKENNIFLIADATHNNMEFGMQHSYPDVLGICQKLDFHEIALIHTASKTYGLERARVGFLLLDKKSKKITIKELEDDLVAVLGTVNDVSKHVAHFLMEIPLENRRNFVKELQSKHKFNMNLMVAYVEGIKSEQIDVQFKEEIAIELPLPYQSGIEGIKVIYKPEGGIHMKINVSGLQNLYYANIRIFNSEIFCYVLNRIMGVVSLHAYCLADPNGFGVRLTFSRKNEVHRGMQLIHDFTKLLKKEPLENPFLPGVLAEDLIYGSWSSQKDKFDVADEGSKKSTEILICS